MAVTLESSVRRYIGLSGDTKPTGVEIGSKFYEYDTYYTYVTYDGTNWALYEMPGVSAAIADSFGAPTTITGIFTTSSASAPIDSNMGGEYSSANHFHGSYIIPLSGAAKYQCRKVAYYSGITGIFYLDYPFTAAPGLVSYLIVPSSPSENRIAVKTPTSVATGALFNITGAVRIVSITGFVTPSAMGTARTLRLSLIPDALAEQFMCAASSSTAFGAGTLLGITGTASDAMVGTTLVGAIPSQVTSWNCRVTTSGTINLTASGASTGTITWECLWRPLNSLGSVTSA
jgi:hypothetical protein